MAFLSSQGRAGQQGLRTTGWHRSNWGSQLPETHLSSFLGLKEYFVGLGKHELIYGYRSERKERWEWTRGRAKLWRDKRCGPERTEKGLEKWQPLPAGAGEHGGILGDSLSLPWLQIQPSSILGEYGAHGSSPFSSLEMTSGLEPWSPAPEKGSKADNSPKSRVRWPHGQHLCPVHDLPCHLSVKGKRCRPLPLLKKSKRSSSGGQG